MKPRSAKCVNFGGCSKADGREVLTIPPGEELTCPECGKMLTATAGGKSGGGKSKTPLLAAIGGLFFVGLLGAFLVWPEPEPQPPPVPQDEVTPDPVPPPVPKLEPDHQEPAPPPPPEPLPKPVPPPPPPPPVINEEQPLPPPVPQPDPIQPEPVYSGPSSGTIVWEGTVSGTELVTIQNGVASQGTLVSGSLPGVAVILQPTDEKRVTIAAAPQPADNYQRLVFRVKNKGRTRVSLRWALP